MRQRGTHRHAGAWTLALATLITFLAVGCRTAEESPAAAPTGSRAVSFESADGVTLDGRLFGDGESGVGVILSHMLPADQTSWWDLAGILAGQGYLVLTYDFRGYCPGGDAGCSQGDKDISAIWQDVVGAIAFVRSEGVRVVELVGASMGGTASLVAAAQEGVDVTAVVTLSAPVQIEGLTADADVLTRITAGKLFIAGVGDATAANAAQELYGLSPPPKRVEIVPSDAHGTDLLGSNRAEEVRTLIVNYLDQFSGV